jgi:hypothetical protein
MSDQEDLVLKFLELTKPIDRDCIVCGDKFKGFREFCGKEDCGKRAIAYYQSRKGSYLAQYGLIDYISTPRKSFLVDYLPEDVNKKE